MDSTVTTPPELIDIPGQLPEMLNVREPVPFAETKAVEYWRTPFVVTTFDPAVTVTVSATTIFMLL